MCIYSTNSEVDLVALLYILGYIYLSNDSYPFKRLKSVVNIAQIRYVPYIDEKTDMIFFLTLFLDVIPFLADTYFLVSKRI